MAGAQPGHGLFVKISVELITVITVFAKLTVGFGSWLRRLQLHL